MMKWRKLGLIFNVDRNSTWMYSHAAVPVAKRLDGSVFRVFFSTRDRENCSSVGFIDIDIESHNRILQVSDRPVLSPGIAGLFDDSGVNACSELEINGVSHLFYTGWSLGVTVPFYTFAGVAKFDKRIGEYLKISRVPLLDRSEEDPFSVGYLQVIHHDSRYRMWYESNLGWVDGSSSSGYRFVIKYAESRDGLIWDRTGSVCIKLNEGEIAVSRPSVLILEGTFHMWYSRKLNGKYGLGYATSQNGFEWCRRDSEIGLTASDSGWDSLEIEYPYVFKYENNIFMLYNGNGYGKSGFGLAVLES